MRRPAASRFFGRRSTWLNRHASHTAAEGGRRQPRLALYLVPLYFAILAVGFLSRSLSGQFETLYPLRLIAGLAVIFHYRRKLAALEWHFSWRAPKLCDWLGGLYCLDGILELDVAVNIARIVVTCNPREARFIWNCESHRRHGADCAHRRGTGVPRIFDAPPDERELRGCYLHVGAILGAGGEQRRVWAVAW